MVGIHELYMYVCQAGFPKWGFTAWFIYGSTFVCRRRRWSQQSNSWRHFEHNIQLRISLRLARKCSCISNVAQRTTLESPYVRQWNAAAFQTHTITALSLHRKKKNKSCLNWLLTTRNDSCSAKRTRTAAYFFLFVFFWGAVSSAAST